MSKELEAVKKEQEDSIAHLMAQGQAIAKKTWNDNLDRVKVVLTDQLAKLNSIKVLDKSVNAKRQEYLDAVSKANEQTKTSVTRPVSKQLSPYGSEQINILKSIVEKINYDSDSYKNSLLVIASRNEYLDKKQDEKIKDIETQISTIDQLKFTL